MTNHSAKEGCRPVAECLQALTTLNGAHAEIRSSIGLHDEGGGQASKHVKPTICSSSSCDAIYRE
jgi:hypothetical protein